MTSPTRGSSIARRVLALGVMGGLLNIAWRLVWPFLSPLAAIGLRELGYGVWLIPPLLGATVQRPGGALAVAALAAGMEWAALGSAPIGARLLTGVVAEGLVWLGRPSLGRFFLCGAIAAAVTLPFDPPAGVSPLAWTQATAAVSRVVSGVMAGGIGWYVRNKLHTDDKYDV